MIDLNKLIRYIELKKEENINDNLVRVILYLGKVESSSFKKMSELEIIPKGTRNFRDLSPNINNILVTTRQGKPRGSYAKLTEKGKEIYNELSNL